MLISFILFFFLLILLFTLSRKVSSFIYLATFLLSQNQKLATDILVILLLPGTIIHEFSHLIIATLLRVPTGELTILPTIEKNGEVRVGRLMLGKADPFRHSIIGLAPIIIGLLLIYFLGKLFLSNFPQLITENRELNTFSLFFLFSIFYFLFSISITMFSSKKDVESLIIVLPIVILTLFSLYIIGVRFFLEKQLVEKITPLLADLNSFLLISAIIDYFAFFLLSLVIYLLQKILKRKIVS